MKMVDLTGLKFGRLTVLEYAGDHKWDCLCECGNKKTVNGGDLKSGSTKSCGCYKKEYMSKKMKDDLSGMKFGNLTVICEDDKKTDDVRWICLCECGNTISVKSAYLKCGDTKSCGCLQHESLIKRNTKHGLCRKTRLYTIWKGMRERCNNPNSVSYVNYGGRGIKVCDEWNDFGVFYEWSMQNGWDESSNLSIDRIDVNDGYHPNNCKFSTRKQQANNTRRNHMIAFNGETHTIAEWADITGISAGRIWSRLFISKWSVDDALTLKVGRNGSKRHNGVG